MASLRSISWQAALWSTTAFVFITLPWLNPFSSGPSPAVLPWLVSLGSFALLLPCASQVRLAHVAPWAWLTAALLSALLGLLQYFGATALFEPWVNASAMGEAFANLRQRNQFATLTNIGLAALLWWVLQDHARPASAPASKAQAAVATLTGWRLLAALAAAVLLACANAASSSRTGLVQLLLLIALVWLWRSRARGWHRSAQARVLLVAALSYGIAAVALPLLLGHNLTSTGILARLHEAGPQCASRLTLWRNVLHLIALKPWFGWGWGELDFAHFITLYPDSRFCELLDNAHNLPLHLAVELGLPLALTVCAGALWLTLRQQPWRETDATRQLAWAVLALILLHSLLEYPLWYGPFQMAFGLCLWLLWRSRERLAAARAVQSLKYLPIAVATGLIAIAAYAAWDYLRVSQIYLTPGQRSDAYRADTLEKIGHSLLFQNQVDFAELTTTPLTRANAAHLNALAKSMLHFSPEPRVIEALIESAALLGYTDEARFYQIRYQAAFPESYARWLELAHLSASGSSNAKPPAKPEAAQQKRPVDLTSASGAPILSAR